MSDEDRLARVDARVRKAFGRHQQRISERVDARDGLDRLEAKASPWRRGVVAAAAVALVSLLYVGAWGVLRALDFDDEAGSDDAAGRAVVASGAPTTSPASATAPSTTSPAPGTTPVAWTVDFESLPCLVTADAGDGGPLPSYPPEPSDAQSVLAMSHLSSGECDRIVLIFGREAAPGPDGAWSGEEALVAPGGALLFFEGEVIRLSLPNIGIAQQGVGMIPFDGGSAVITPGTVRPGDLELRVIFDTPRRAATEYLLGPGRIIVDFVEAE